MSDDQLQQLNLFAIKKFDNVSEGTKALIYLLWKKPENSLCNYSKSQIDNDLMSFDTLHFDWSLLPKHVFEELFLNFSYEQLCYICGSKGMKFDPKLIRKSGITNCNKSKKKLIDNLWKFLNNNQ
jgi:hypothetical protein